MANPQHVEYLKKGADRWNTWRHKNSHIKIDLSRDIFSGIDLSEFDLSLADLSNSNFSQANLSGAVLSRTDLSWADFSNANFSNAYLMHTNFYRTDLSSANFNSASLRRTLFSFTDLSKVKNLELCHFEGPCSLDYHTLTVSKPLPQSFLQGIGLPNDYIEYIKSLPEPLHQCYSCFIAYSEKDNDFSQKLYNDLKNTGIDCERWREGVKIGDRIIRWIHQAVEDYDKVIVILSKNSLKSENVHREISRTLKKELALRKKDPDAEVLIPVKVDDYINSSYCKYEHTSELTDKRIGNFMKWEDPNSYQKAFQLLLTHLEKK